jgi:hypothetical protein
MHERFTLLSPFKKTGENRDASSGSASSVLQILNSQWSGLESKPITGALSAFMPLGGLKL